ncbi:MAG: MarR family winged helix-turn-helix transcriptional regulator [Paracoccaceae bacterium]
MHLARAARSEDGKSDLTPAQWTCLRFFARANGSTRTPSGFASFQATTRGTASQIIKSLEGRGLIARTRSGSDGRSVRLDLTEAGRALLARDPLGSLIGVIATLPAADRAQFLGTLSRVASAAASLRQGVAFGTCLDCSHFTPADSGGACACMAAHLAADETTQLCGSYRGSCCGLAPTHGEYHDRT